MKNLITKPFRILLILVGFFLSAESYAQDWQLVWSDEFDQPTLNTSNWNIEVNDLGGGNNELQYYTSRPENVRVENHNLIIEARRENYLTRSYTSGRLNSRNKKSWKYGKIEAKMKLPYGNGMWPAFWMMGNTGSWPACGEIDIMEMVGGSKCGWDCGDNKTHGYMWWSDGGDKSVGTQSTPLPSGKYADDYHYFSVEWNEQEIKWFVDDKQFYSHSITEGALSEFHQPFYLLLNIAVGGDWPGSPDASTVFPQRLYVDYVRVYQRGTCTSPAQPGAITGNTTVSPGSTQTYSIASVANATSYTWTLPSGWSGTSTSTTITTTAGNAGGTISVRANNSCGSSATRTLTVSVSGCTLPAQPGAISGNTSVTAGSTQTYSIAVVANATSYTWSLPSGWSGSSTSTSITTTVGATGGTVSVRANNSCGAGAARTLPVTVGGTSSNNIALNKPVTVSSIEAAGLEGSKAVDGSLSTRWASAYNDSQWLYVDLGDSYSINRVKITWEAAYGRNYEIQTSSNASSWSSIKTITGNTTLVNDHSGLSGTGRYVRINGTQRGTQWGYSIFELEVYGTLSTGGGGFTARVEAEDYVYMSGVIKETCSEGGLHIGSFDANDWAAYNVTIPATGTYQATFRVASINSGRTLRLEKDNGTTLLATATVPNTGDWQTWSTTVPVSVTLPAGSYAIGLTSYTGGVNVNWLEITNNLTAARESVSLMEEEKSGDHHLYPNPVQGGFLNIQTWADYKGGSIKIIDASGREHYNGVADKDHVDVSSLPAGLYVLRIIKGKSAISKTFSKK
jgi:beta-glucanase (GH16 family)